jgi:hypothetical protein
MDVIYGLVSANEALRQLNLATSAWHQKLGDDMATDELREDATENVERLVPAAIYPT